MTSNKYDRTGSCLCGAVKFEVAGPFRDIMMCHCNQCQKASGHHAAATAAPTANFHFLEEAGLRWYKSSGHAERGFCCECGSSLFWRMGGRDSMSIFVGCLDGDIDLPISQHIFVADKKKYYEIEGKAPQYGTYPK
ncbi:MAG: GFA family protein [Sneathiella sp.]|nr:GFA family protein [Sneathiella sp.]